MNSFKKLSLLLIFFSISFSGFSQEITPSEQPTSLENQLFGKSIALSGSWALIGAPQKDVSGKQSVGSVFFYQSTHNEGWKNIQEITPPELPQFSGFGTSVDISGWNSAAISSMGSIDGGLFSEAVYIYDYEDASDSWVQSQILKPSDSKRGMRFGSVLTFNGSPYESDILAVGAYNGDGNEIKSGAVYIFEKSDSGWVETQKLIASDGESNDFFGQSLDMLSIEYGQSNRLIVGAYNATGAAERSGAVYIFDQNEEGIFEETMKIYDPNGSSSDLFGYSVVHSQPQYIIVKENTLTDCYYENVLFIGAPGSNNENGQTGSVYNACSDGNNWTIVNEFSDPESSENEHFGTSLALDQYNGLVFVGANRASSGEGSIYTYSYYDGGFENLDYVQPPVVPNLSEDEYYGTDIASSGFGDLIISSPYKTIDGKENSGGVYFYSYPIVSNEDEPLGEIKEYKLEQNYPNPFNPSTEIRYQVKEAGNVKLTVYNLLGQVVQVLVNEKESTGAYSVNFDASALSSGFYFYRLEVNDFSSTKKMMLIK